MPRTSFRCVAFLPSLLRAPQWTRCRRRSQRNDRFCRAHRDALDGLILGLQQWEQRLHGAEKENEAYASIAETNVACQACGARLRWKIPRKRKRRRLLLAAAKRETPPRAQISEVQAPKRRSSPRLPVAPSEPEGN